MQRGKFKPIVPKDKRKKAAQGEDVAVKVEPEDDGAFKDLMRAVHFPSSSSICQKCILSGEILVERN